MPHEIELKLAFPPDAQAQILHHQLIATAPQAGKAQTLINTYYDTPDLTLSKARVAIRTRKAGQKWLQTVKCASESVGGLSSRPEWEQRFTGTFDFSGIDDPATRKLLEKHAGAIVPLFTTEFHRDTRLMEPSPGVRILAMIDTGTIRTQGREAPISELELELQEGTPSDLLDVAISLASELPLLPYDPSKAERGYQLFHNVTPAPTRAARSPLEKGWTPYQAFRALTAEAQTAWQANLFGAQSSDDPNYVHQMRIALRRLRTMLRVFAPLLPGDFVETWSATFARIADSVGESRDLEILRTTILEPVLSATGDPSLEELANRAHAASEAAKEPARAALAPQTQGALMLGFIKAQEGLNASDADEDLTAFARSALRKVRRRARARLETAKAQKSDESLHRLRITTKQLRYTSEFFEPLFRSKKMKRYMERVTRLQEELGFLQDLAVAQTKLTQWAGDEPALQQARAFLGGFHAPKAAKVRKSVLKRAEKVLTSKSPWRKTTHDKKAKQ